MATAKKLFHLLVMKVKGPALAVLRGNREQNGVTAWRALTKRYEPDTAPRVQSLMSSILNAQQLPSELTAYETALAEWEETIRKWEMISGDHFNPSMKKALFIDKAPMTVKMLLQMQNLDDYAQMTQTTLQFLQSNASYKAGVPTRQQPKADQSAMEVDALTRKRKEKGGNGKGLKTDGQAINLKADLGERRRVLLAR